MSESDLEPEAWLYEAKLNIGNRRFFETVSLQNPEESYSSDLIEYRNVRPLYTEDMNE